MVEMAREGARERKERSRRHKLHDHSMCIKGDFCPAGEVKHIPRSSRSQVTSDGTGDGTGDRTPRQDNTKQDNSRSVSIVSSVGATTDAPNGALVFAPEMENWLHPYFLGDKPNCLICTKEKSNKHIDPEQTSSFVSLAKSLVHENYFVEVGFAIQEFDHQIFYEIKARKFPLEICYQTTSLKIDGTSVKDITPNSLTGHRVITTAFAEFCGADKTEDFGQSVFGKWIKPAEDRAKLIEGLNVDAEQEFGFEWYADHHKNPRSGEMESVVDFWIYASPRFPNLLTNKSFQISQFLKVFAKLPEPPMTSSNELHPTESENQND